MKKKGICIVLCMVFVLQMAFALGANAASTTAGPLEIGKNYRLLDGCLIYDGDGNPIHTSRDQSCVKLWDHKTTAYLDLYFICTTGWNGGAETVQEHAIGWVSASSLGEWTQKFSVGQKVMYMGGHVYTSLNGIEAGTPVSGPCTVAEIIDFKAGEHPYFIRDTHNGVYMGWVEDVYTIAAYTTGDVELVAAYVSGQTISMTPCALKFYDMNGDGVLTMQDVVSMAQVVNQYS